MTTRQFGSPDKYGLPAIPVGEVKAFSNLTPVEHSRIKRSAHNYNARTGIYFVTKMLDGVLYVTRIR
jgi:hypothetical protein